MNEGEMAKGYTRDRTDLTIRLELDKIKTKKHNTYRSSTYTTLLRLYRTKKVSIRERAYTVLRI